MANSGRFANESIRYTYVIDALVIIIAAYLCVVPWISHFRESGNRGGSKSRKRLLEVVLLSTALLSTFAATICCVLMTEMFMGNLRVRLAKVLGAFCDVFYYLSLTTSYCVLWQRQRIIYTTPALSQLSNRISRGISKYFIVYIIISQVVLQAAIVSYIYTTSCRLDLVCEMTAIAIKEAVYSVSNQIPLLCLMIFPLYRHHTTNLMTNEKYVTLMKRITIAALVCLISDITDVLVFKDYSPSTLWFPQPLNMLVNLLSVTLAPIRWRAVVFPCVRSTNVTDLTKAEELQKQKRDEGAQLGNKRMQTLV